MIIKVTPLAYKKCYAALWKYISECFRSVTNGLIDYEHIWFCGAFGSHSEAFHVVLKGKAQNKFWLLWMAKNKSCLIRITAILSSLSQTAVCESSLNLSETFIQSSS